MDADGNALREADGSLQMRPAQPMEYANGVRHIHCKLGHSYSNGVKEIHT